MDNNTIDRAKFEKVSKELWRALGVDEKTNDFLVAAAKRELGVSYEFHENQRAALITIHADYLQFDDLPEGIASRYLSEAALRKAEIATREYKIALRDCDFWGAMISEKILKDATEVLRRWRELIERHRENGFVFGAKSVFFKRGNPGNPRLRFYIYQMAKWYKKTVGKKPAYGKGSIFPRLISACLAIVDEDWIEKDPPYGAIENTLKEMDSTF